MRKKSEIRKVKEQARELIDSLKDLQSDPDIGKMIVLDEDPMGMILDVSILRIEFLIKRLNRLIDKAPRDSRGRKRNVSKSVQK